MGNKQEQSRVAGLLAVFALVLLAVTSMTVWLSKGSEHTQRKHIIAVQAEAPAAIGGSFTLTDQNGHTVKSSDFKGRLLLVYFGYSRCPDVCPVTLATIGSVMSHLGDKAKEVVPLFITLDPGNDTPQVLKDYLTNFNPSIIGLTGTREQVEAAAKAYKVYFTPENGGKVDHSSIIYLMGRDGQYLTHFSSTDTEKAMLDAIAPNL